MTGGEVLYMDKEKARLIEELLKRDRLVASLSELVRQLQTENETLGEQLDELAKAKQGLEKPAKDSKTSSQPLIHTLQKQKINGFNASKIFLKELSRQFSTRSWNK